MKRLFLLIGLVVFLTPSLVSAKEPTLKNFLNNIYYNKETLLTCSELELSFRIIEKKILFFDAREVVVSYGLFSARMFPTYFSSDLIEGDIDYEVYPWLDKFKIYPNLKEVVVTRFQDNDYLFREKKCKLLERYP